MEERLEYFELNNEILEDFDNLMKMHLDQVKYLKINENIINSKLYNIIGLCFNINILEIDADIKLDVNKIFASVCKPGLLEKIKLVNVKLPIGKYLNKFNNIKEIELKNIKFSNVKEFILSLNCKKSLEKIYIEEVEFSNNNLEFLEEYTNLKNVQIINMINFKLEKLNFLSKSKKIQEVILKGNKVKIEELNNLTKGNYKKDIQLQLESKGNFLNIKDKKINIKTEVQNIEKMIDNISFYKISNLDIIFNEQTNFEEFIQILRKVKNKVTICITDISKLSVTQIQILKEKLDINDISLLDEYGQILITYDIKTFLSMREAIEKFIGNIPEELKKEEKILWIYKILLKNIKYDENNIECEDELKKGLIEGHCISKGYAEILKNCLLCLGFEVNNIRGILKKDNIEWNWIQLKIDEKWYNADIALDAKENKKMKYCLINNEKISKTHKFETDSMYCVEEYDYKEILKFWKSENVIKKEKKSILEGIVKKLKVLFMINKRLTEGENKDIKEEK